MISLDDIAERFIEQVDYQVSVRQKPNSEYIADYLVSLLPDDQSSKLEPVHPDKRLFSQARSLKGFFASTINAHKEDLASAQWEALNEAYKQADGELRLLDWDSKSVGEVLSDMIYDEAISTDKVGETLAQIAEDRINSASARSQNPNSRIEKAVRPIIREAVTHLKSLDSFADFKELVNDFTNQKRALESLKQEVGYAV